MTLANAVVIPSGQTGTMRITASVLPKLSGDYSGVAGTLTLDVSGAAGYNGFNIQTGLGPAVGSVVDVLGATGADNVQISINSADSQSFFANTKVSITATGAGNTYFQAGNDGASNAQFGALDGGNATTLIGFDNRPGSTITIDGLADGDFAGNLSNGGASSGINLVKAGPATQTLSGVSTYTGATTINGGTLRIGDGGTAGALSTASTIVDNATLAFNRNNIVTQGTDFSGDPITGTGGLAQSGSGDLILVADNSYTGPTTVNAGTLTINGNLTATSVVNVNDGGTLTGIGTHRRTGGLERRHDRRPHQRQRHAHARRRSDGQWTQQRNPLRSRVGRRHDHHRQRRSR